MDVAQKKRTIEELKKLMNHPASEMHESSLDGSGQQSYEKEDPHFTLGLDAENSLSKSSSKGNSVFEDTPEKAYEKILKLLSYSDRCSYDLTKKLTDAGFSEQSISLALSRAQNANYVNDQRFAQYFAAAQLRAGKGSRGVQQALVKKGFAVAEVSLIVEEALEEVEPESQRALKFLENHPPHSKNIRESAFRKLVNKGFSVSVASEAAKQYAADVNAQLF